MFDIELIKRTAKEVKMPLAELAEKIGYSEAGFHKAIANGTLNLKAIIKLSQVLSLPLEEFIQKEEVLTLATVINKVNQEEPDSKWGDMVKGIEQERQYLRLTIEGLLEQLKEKDNQIREKDSQIDKFIIGMSQKDELISDYLYMLKHLTADRFKNTDNGVLKGNPKQYRELQEKE
jgi:transcriptional regulator with XRE-family HTH domain